MFKGRTKNKNGFTVVEVMIFLAVSGFLFISTYTIFNRYQRSSRFAQAVRDVESNLNDIINDTLTGNYPEYPPGSGFRCSYVGNSAIFTPVANSTIGDNNDCLFLGKAIQFVDNGVPGNDQDDTYNVHTIVGKNDPNDSSINSFETASPDAFYKASPAGFDTTEEFQINWGVGIERAFYDETSPKYLRGVAIVYTNFGNQQSADTLDVASRIALYAIRSDTPGSIAGSAQTVSDFRDEINANDSDGHIFAKLDQTVYICLEDQYQQRATIEIAGTSSRLNAVANFNPPAECI